MESLFGNLENDSYLAHICPEKLPETLKEHTEKVVERACWLIGQHGLEKVIDRLIVEIAGKGAEGMQEELKRMFAAVFVFHDTGKVNDNFQCQRMLNPLFKRRKTEMLEPPYGHSFLGAWLFLSFMLDRVWKETGLTEKEKKCLFVYAFLFSYVIRQHHSSGLGYANEEAFLESFAGCYEELQMYLTVWGFEGDWTYIEAVFKCITEIRKETEKMRKIPFALYALIKLNSSLLTAADYLATHEYVNGYWVKNAGIFQDRRRVEEVIAHLRRYKHNRTIYEHLEEFVFSQPQERSGDHLNRLRTEMAVEVIQTIRKHADEWLFYIEAPTGGGKTNLSMLALTELMAVHPEIQKVFYVFPYTTLVTQTYQALSAALGLTSSELAELHSKAAFKEDEEEKEDGLYGGKQQDYIDRLFALFPVCVLSHVKFFDMLKSNRKEANYIFHRLANSVVVIDELQSYNPLLWDKMYYLIEHYARLFQLRFILMSATLPKIGKLHIPLKEKTGFVDLLPRAKSYMQNPNFAQRVEFRFDLFQEETEIDHLADFVLKKSEEYRQRNTTNGTVHTIIEFIYKKSASEFYAWLQEREMFFDEVLILSGTILEPRRREIINYLKNPMSREKNILLITTQVVEAGVDIDMDLGFKNISLIDSDEQLAGRVNRNAWKTGCEVYLFRLDEACVLYGRDKRYQIVREQITAEEYKRILREKDFGRLYELVFEVIDSMNEEVYIQNFHSIFLKYVECLDYQQVDRNFRVIEQQNEIVFVPLCVPVEVDSPERGVKEKLLSGKELEFLKAYRVIPRIGMLDGKEVWEVYERLVQSRSGGKFDLNGQVDFKMMQRILSCFTFSLICYSKELQELKCGMGEEKLGYFYLSHWEQKGLNGQLYDYKMGLNSRALKDIAFI